MRAHSRPLAALLLCLLPFACGRAAKGVADADFVDASPDVDALTLDPSGSGPTREAKPDAVVAGEALVKDLNDQIKSIVGKIKEAIADEQTLRTHSKLVHVWQFERDGVSFRFTMRRAGLVFGWKLEVKKTSDADPAYVKVMSGAIRRAADAPAHHGAGVIGFDFDKYAEVATGSDVALKTVGQVLMAFKHGPRGAHLAYRVRGFSTDPALRPPLSAYFDGIRLATTPVRVLIHAGGQYNYDKTSDALEKVALHLRRVVGIGGWARGIAFDGDLKTRNVVRLMRECWNREDGVAYRRVWECGKPANAGDRLSAGCTLIADLSFPAAAGDALATETNDPSSTDALTPLRQLCFPDAPALGRQALLDAAANDTDPAADLDATTGDVPSSDSETLDDIVPTELPGGEGGDIPG